MTIENFDITKLGKDSIGTFIATLKKYVVWKWEKISVILISAPKSKRTISCLMHDTI